MPDHYCINTKPHPDGNYAIHNISRKCSTLPDYDDWLSDSVDWENLGWTPIWLGAIEEASRRGYRKVDGCAECCSEFHQRLRHRVDAAIKVGLSPCNNVG